MEVTSISEGLILDHIPAGTAFKVLRYLHIDEKTARLALIMNASSVRYGTKDIIKIEGRSEIDLNVLALVAKVRAGTVCLPGNRTVLWPLTAQV